MSPGADPGFCNLECWCHVPTRGLNKPPCYLCVINCCSLSSKKEVTPSAPNLSPTDERAPPSYSPNMVYIEGLSAVGASSTASRYGWRDTLVRTASLESERGNENNRRNFREIFVRIPSEQNAQLLPETGEPSREIELRESPVNELNRLEAPKGDQEQDVRMVEGNVNASSAEETPKDHITTVEVNHDNDSETDADLAERIRHIVVDEKDATDEEDEEVPGRCNRTGIRTPNDRNKNRRRRDKYQGLYNLDARYCCIPRASLSSHNSASASSVQNETEFQRLHKIHRRDTSLDAAKRYLQSDENLHRTWMREVAVRRRNYPKRNRSSKRHEEGSHHRPIFTYEEAWRQHQRQHHKQLSKDSGVDT